MNEFDVIVVGSGAGGGPVALWLADAGYRVVVLEKGPALSESEFCKDEVGEVRRPRYVPPEHEEPRVLETPDGRGGYAAATSSDAGIATWNGCAVGGATNFMSGFFLRMKPEDFRLRSTYGVAPGADVVDWPIGYDDLEPWYDLVEREVGVSGRVVEHPRKDRRSSPDFPMPPTAEHAFAKRVDEVGRARGLFPLPLPRAILSRERPGRRKCDYTGFCGSYGCASGAKGSARAALLSRAVATGRCEIRTGRMVTRLETDASGRVVAVHHVDKSGGAERLAAKVVVLAAQAIESSRLLLLSTGPRHPRGIGNGNDLVGRHLLTSPAGVGWGVFPYAKWEKTLGDVMRDRGAFVNRTFEDWQDYADPATGRKRKGGCVDFLLMHSNAIQSAMVAASTAGAGTKRPLFGRELQQHVRRWFSDGKALKFETFSDWMPLADGRVTLDPSVRDRFGLPVARIRWADHAWNHETTEFLAARGAELLRAMGAEDVFVSADAGPSTNLVAGGARFGRDRKTSVLDVDGRVHDADNLFVTDGSFMPTGGSVPYTFTIYANAFRVAERIAAQLGGSRK
jgi:choline dehydrogenase-like flavoprotein